MMETVSTLTYGTPHIALKLSKSLEDDYSAYDDLLLNNHSV